MRVQWTALHIPVDQSSWNEAFGADKQVQVKPVTTNQYPHVTSAAPHSLNCGVLQAHSRGLPFISITPAHLTPDNPLADPGRSLFLTSSVLWVTCPESRHRRTWRVQAEVGYQKEPHRGLSCGHMVWGNRDWGCGEPVETAAGAAPALLPLSSRVVNVQFSADETKHFTKLSPVPQWASGCTCGHMGAASAQWACWSALGWVPPALMQSPNWRPVPLNINRTLLRPARFAFSATHLGSSPGTCSKSH